MLIVEDRPFLKDIYLFFPCVQPIWGGAHLQESMKDAAPESSGDAAGEKDCGIAEREREREMDTA